MLCNARWSLMNEFTSHPSDTTTPPEKHPPTLGLVSGQFQRLTMGNARFSSLYDQLTAHTIKELRNFLVTRGHRGGRHLRSFV